MDRKLAALLKVTQMAHDADLMALRNVAAQIDQLCLEISDLSEQSRSELKTVQVERAGDLSALASQIEAREIWFTDHKTRMNARLAQLHVKYEESRNLARISFGRNDALLKTASRMHSEASTKARRRL